MGLFDSIKNFATSTVNALTENKTKNPDGIEKDETQNPLFSVNEEIVKDVDSVEDELVKISDTLKLDDTGKNDKDNSPIVVTYKVQSAVDQLSPSSTEDFKLITRNILDGDNFSSNDKVALIKEFLEENDFSLLPELESVFSNEDDKKSILNEFTSAISDLVDAGSKDAIKLLCEEMRTATSGRIGTYEDVIKSIFDTASDKTLIALFENYTDVTEGEDLLETMKKELSAEEYNNYTDKINNAILDNNINESGEKTTLTDEQAMFFASQFAYGSELSYTNILNNTKLSSEDKILIMNAYKDMLDGSLLSDVGVVYKNEFTENKMLNNLTSSISEMVDAGSKDAIKLLCEEMHTATSGRIGTDEDVVKSIFDTASDKTLIALFENYTDVTEGEDLLETMKKELSAEEYNNYTDKINNAILDNNVNENGEKTPLTEQQALMFASQLAMGNVGNIDSYTNILTNEKLSAEDKQAIINAFEKITGASLLDDIADVYGNKYTENKMLQNWQLN